MVVAQWLWLGGHRAGGSGSAGLVLAGPLFYSSKKKSSLLASISALWHGRESHGSTVIMRRLTTVRL